MALVTQPLRPELRHQGAAGRFAHSFAALLENGFRDQFTAHLVNERLFGTGVGEFEGVMNSPALMTVSKDTNQATKTITYSNVIGMWPVAGNTTRRSGSTTTTACRS